MVMYARLNISKQDQEEEPHFISPIRRMVIVAPSYVYGVNLLAWQVPTHTSLNRLAWNVTVHCFTGCAIGEVMDGRGHGVWLGSHGLGDHRCRARVPRRL